MTKKLAFFILSISLGFSLSACSIFPGPNCDSGTERRPGDLVTGQKPADATIATLCTDRTDYNKGDTVHMTYTLKNLLDEQIVLGDDQRLVMDMCVEKSQCLSNSQPDVAQLTRLVLEPGQSHTIQWDWPPPDADLTQAVDPVTNDLSVRAHWIRLDGADGMVMVQVSYGPRQMMP